MTPYRALVFSATAAAIVLGSSVALGGFLEARARRDSHELPPWTGLPTSARATLETLTRTGHDLYLNSCAHCHGADARGDEGPDLHALQVSDRRIANVVLRGIPGEMPSFAKKHSPEEVAALIAYLRTLD